MLGETNPAASLPGTIRGDFAVEVGVSPFYDKLCFGYLYLMRGRYSLPFYDKLCCWVLTYT